MSFDEELAAARRSRGSDPDALGELARAALEQQREEEVLPLLGPAAAQSNNARLWQWKGLLERALDEHAQALQSFAEAAHLAPDDASIAHGHARTAMEAGLPAIALFTRALKLAPGDAQVYLGLNAARIAEGQGEQAEAELDEVLRRSPMWLEGHHQLAQFRSLLGRREHAFDSVERAIAAQPNALPLWQALFELHILAEDYAALDAALLRAQAARVAANAVASYRFIAAAEHGPVDLADALLRSEGEQAIPPVWRIRHYLRTGRAPDALPLIDAELAGPRAIDARPYAATAWQVTGDPRAEWLLEQPGLFATLDLQDELAAIAGLADRLRAIHEVSGRYLNQSVRGGSQTDGPLFSRIEPEIRALRSVIVGAVERFAEGLADLPDGHPQKRSLKGRRVRFSGSWSVRLVDGGYHTSHVHPRGWISSAMYINLPGQLDEGEGWLSLGEPPPDLGVAVPPLQTIQPKIGRLVLFPSWMWHGTRPFREGERMTVAFDVAPPL